MKIPLPSRQQWIMESKIGQLFLVASEKGLQGVFWKKQLAPLAKSLKSSEPEVRTLAQAVRELDEYFEYKRRNFTLSLDVKGAPFQQRVWEELSRIPYGKTCSYGELAIKLNHAKAFRAVGTANGRNPLCIVVPCHRVIASDGSLGGYSGGMEIKTQLLKLEQEVN